MRSVSVRWIVALAVCLFGGVTWGQEPQLVSYFGGASEASGYKAGQAAGGLAGGWTFYFGAEAALLTPHLGAITVVDPLVYEVTPEFDWTPSPRLWLGIDNAEGLGARMTYWVFDGDETSVNTGLGVDVRAQTLDFDVYQKGCMGPIEFQVSGGLRYGKLSTGLWGGGTPLVSAEFEGIGPTLAVEGRRPIGCWNLALVGGLRGSWLYGQTTGEIPTLGAIEASQHMMQVWDARLGIQWERQTALGTLGVHALYEAQAWEWAPLATIIHEDVGFVGPTLGVTLVR